MRLIRGAAALTGVLMGAWGVWLIRDFRLDQLESAGIWLVAGIIFHDGILAPAVVAFGALLVKVVPAYARKPATVGLILWGTATVAVANVLSGKGGKPDNATVLDRPYAMTWLILTGVLVAIVGLDVIRRRPRKSPPKVVTKGRLAT